MFRAAKVSLFFRIRVARYFCVVTAQQSHISHEAITKATQKWIQSIVVKYRLCPWAASHMNNLDISILEDNRMTKYEARASQSLHEECAELVSDFSKKSGHYLSRFIVLPQLGVFEEYLEFTENLNEFLEYSELDAEVQVATFHPRYQFEGISRDAPENWTNRSPYPTLHLLKVSDVSRAIDTYDGSTDAIWEKNVVTMRSEGNLKMQLLLSQIINESQK